jgi:hypothetical protein
MPRLQLSFHTTFALKKEDLLKILQAASEETGLNDSLENLMQRTGLGNKKVAPMRFWAIRAGLIEDKRLTPEGKVVLKLDPHLEAIITDWLMHFYLSFGDKGLKQPPENLSDWGGWTYLVYNFLLQHQSFTAEELQHYSALVFEQEKPQSLAKNFRIVLRAYIESYALASCKFITQEKDHYQTGNARLPNPYLIGYFLAKLWERDFKGQGSVLTESILNQKMGLAPVLGLKTEAVQKLLNTLDDYGIIEHQRAVPPFHVIPRWDNPLILLEKAYDSDR